MRADYGFTRTACACRVCVRNCETMSGMVAPADLERWRAEHGADFERWALEHLAASPGAIVSYRGEVFRIPTLVPRRLASGRCHWLVAGACTIHPTAPYGCAMFDCSMSNLDGQRRSRAALEAILEDQRRGGPYDRLWRELHARGQTAAGPEACRDA